MNGILRKISEARERQWADQTRGQVLSADLVVSPENLFVCSLDELKQLDLAMMDQFTNQGWALKAKGAAYELSFHAQRKILAELIEFEQGHRDFNPLADGQRIHDWIKANSNGEFTSNAMHLAFIACKSLDDVCLAEPPIITRQPAERVIVVEGEPAIFSVAASGTGLSYQWYQDGKVLLDAIQDRYQFPNTDWFQDRSTFHVVVSNAIGEVHSREAVLRVVKA